MVIHHLSGSVHNPLVDILLSTYNGERYLSQLFDSIVDQSYPYYRVLVRDDGSDDSTTSIIHDYNKRYPDKFIIIDLSKKNVGYSRSFSILLAAARAEHIAFCDQDDIWVSNKLERQVVEMLRSQERFGKQTPILVHSDLMICNYKMKFISDSLWKYQKIAPQKMKDIRLLIVQNFVTGCTILMNRALADIIESIPERAITFDWWIALLALEQGQIVTIQESLVMYRQHKRNVIGAQKWGTGYLISMAIKKRYPWKVNLKKTVLQAAELIRYSNVADRDIISQYALMDKKKWVEKKFLYRRLGIKKFGFLRQFFAWLFI